MKHLNWITPHIMPFILGMILGGLLPLQISFVSQRQTSIEHQAAQGGAVVPFQLTQSKLTQPNGSPLQVPSTLPPSDLNEEKYRIS